MKSTAYTTFAESPVTLAVSVEVWFNVVSSFSHLLCTKDTRIQWIYSSLEATSTLNFVDAYHKLFPFHSSRVTLFLHND